MCLPSYCLKGIFWDCGLQWDAEQIQVASAPLRAPRGLSVYLGWGEPHYFWYLTPVGPFGRLIAWPAGACVHRLPHGFSLAHFGDSLSVAFFLATALLEGRVSSHLTAHTTVHPLTSHSPGFAYLTASRKLLSDIRTETMETKPEVLGICSSQYSLQTGSSLFPKVGV